MNAQLHNFQKFVKQELLQIYVPRFAFVTDGGGITWPYEEVEKNAEARPFPSGKALAAFDPLKYTFVDGAQISAQPSGWYCEKTQDAADGVWCGPLLVEPFREAAVRILEKSGHLSDISLQTELSQKGYRLATAEEMLAIFWATLSVERSAQLHVRFSNARIFGALDVNDLADIRCVYHIARIICDDGELSKDAFDSYVAHSEALIALCRERPKTLMGTSARGGILLMADYTEDEPKGRLAPSFLHGSTLEAFNPDSYHAKSVLEEARRQAEQALCDATEKAMKEKEEKAKAEKRKWANQEGAAAQEDARKRKIMESDPSFADYLRRNRSTIVKESGPLAARAIDKIAPPLTSGRSDGPTNARAERARAISRAEGARMREEGLPKPVTPTRSEPEQKKEAPGAPKKRPYVGQQWKWTS
jgi:hypothetical protein